MIKKSPKHESLRAYEKYARVDVADKNLKVKALKYLVAALLYGEVYSMDVLTGNWPGNSAITNLGASGKSVIIYTLTNQFIKEKSLAAGFEFDPFNDNNELLELMRLCEHLEITVDNSEKTSSVTAVVTTTISGEERTFTAKYKGSNAYGMAICHAVVKAEYSKLYPERTKFHIPEIYMD